MADTEGRPHRTGDEQRADSNTTGDASTGLGEAGRRARRRQIADAVVRLASREGLHAVTMRGVAEEAGISLRLVQYYFGTKEQLLSDTFQYLGEQFGERIRRRLAGVATTPRALLQTLLEESLPTDAESRAFHLYYTSYAVLAMTRPDLTAPVAQGPHQMIQLIVSHLESARGDGTMPADLDPHAEAMGLLALSAGLGSSVMAGQQSADQAAAILRYHLDRILPPDASSGPAEPPA